MKKIVLSLVLFAGAACTALAQHETVNGVKWFYYVDGKNHAIIEDWFGKNDGLAIPRATSGDLVVPSSLGGYKVTEIGSSALEGCNKITSVKIPSSVATIGHSAFKGCTSLASVKFSSGLKAIEMYAFKGCEKLTSVKFPSSVRYIGIEAFSDCTSLDEVVIPRTLPEIASWAFEHTPFYDSICANIDAPERMGELVVLGSVAYDMLDPGITTIRLPDTVTTIGSTTFQGCYKLASVTIPSSVTKICGSAFLNCKSLEDVDVPKSVTMIGDTQAFEGTPFYNNLPDGLVVLGSVLYGMKGAGKSSVTVPKGVVSICSRAFLNSETLTSVKIPEGVTEIGGFSFGWCKSLTSVTIPKSMTEIVDFAFENSPALKTVRTVAGDTGRVKKLYAWPESVKFVESSPAIPASLTYVPGKKVKLDLKSLCGSKAKFSLYSGKLPSGLTLKDGVISGTPKGSSTVKIKVKTDLKTYIKTIAFKAENPGFKVTVTAGANGESGEKKISSGKTATLYLGVSGKITVAATPGVSGVTDSAATIKVSGLPEGLKYSKGKISGTPTKKETKAVSVKCTNKWGWSKTFKFTIKVSSLPGWVQGEYNGGLYAPLSSLGKGSAVSLALSSKGVLSGKVRFSDDAWSLSATKLSPLSSGGFKIKAKRVDAKGNALSAVTLTLKKNSSYGRKMGLLVQSGVFDAWQNRWTKDADLKAAASSMTGAKRIVSSDELGELALTFGDDGSVTAVDKNKRSASAVLCYDDNYYFAYLYFAKKGSHPAETTMVFWPIAD